MISMVKFLMITGTLIILIGCRSISSPTSTTDRSTPPAGQDRPTPTEISDTMVDKAETETPTPQPDQSDHQADEPTISETPTPALSGHRDEPKAVETDSPSQGLSQVSEQIAGTRGSYFLIQFSTTLSDELRRQLLEAGVILYDPFDNNVYQAYIPARALPFLETLLRNEVVAVDVIPPQGKIKAPLNDPAQLVSRQSYPITVQFFDAPTEAEKAMLEEKMTVDTYAQGVMNFAQGRALGQDLMAIAQLPFVKLIEDIVPATGGGGEQ